MRCPRPWRKVARVSTIGLKIGRGAEAEVDGRVFFKVTSVFTFESFARQTAQDRTLCRGGVPLLRRTHSSIVESKGSRWALLEHERSIVSTNILMGKLPRLVRSAVAVNKKDVF